MKSEEKHFFGTAKKKNVTYSLVTFRGAASGDDFVSFGQSQVPYFSLFHCHGRFAEQKVVIDMQTIRIVLI